MSWRPSGKVNLMQALGVDIGGTGIKAAPVDVAAGKLLAERHEGRNPAAIHPQGGGRRWWPS